MVPDKSVTNTIVPARLTCRLYGRRSVRLVPVVLLPCTMMVVSQGLLRWALMWLLAGAIYGGLKWLS